MKRKKMVIYDYRSNKIEVPLPDKEIASIHVIVVSGDEIGSVKFDDGSILHFDADVSDSRCQDFYDGSYEVDGDDVRRWLNWDNGGKAHASYKRKNFFESV